MVVMLVSLTVKPELLDTFKEVALTNARASRTEPGNLRFDVIQQQDDPHKFVLIEVYRDEDARQAHFATDHYREWKAASTQYDFFSEKANLLYTPLFPVEVEKWEAN